MPLVLTLGPAGGASADPVHATRTLHEGRLTIGRGPGNDWILPDPSHHLSRTHCVIAFVDGGYVLTDLSTNGVFVNGATEPLSPDRRVVLADGDAIELGGYRITVAEVVPPTEASAVDSLIGQQRAAFAYPFAAVAAPRQDDPFDRLDEARSPQMVDHHVDHGADHRDDPEDDLFHGTRPLDVWQGPSQPDNADAPALALAQPKFVAVPQLDDADIDALLGDTPPGEPPARMAPAPCPAPAAPAAPPAPVRLPADGASLAQFLEGAGVRLDPDTNPAVVLRTAGEVFRAMVEGLRAVLMSRAAIKSEFRADQTILRAADNNPLKFSLSADEAIAALLQPARAGYLQPLAATTEAFADVKSHELAVMAGMQAALKSLLHRINPARLEDQPRAGAASLLPLAHKAHCWDQFRATYKELTHETEDSFQSRFGRDFARAYEQQARRV